MVLGNIAIPNETLAVDLLDGKNSTPEENEETDDSNKVRKTNKGIFYLLSLKTFLTKRRPDLQNSVLVSTKSRKAIRYLI